MNSNPRTPQSKTRLNCPTCGRGYLFEVSTAVPFCSERCRLIDLGRWLEEDIGVPFDGDTGEADVDRRDPDSED